MMDALVLATEPKLQYQMVFFYAVIVPMVFCYSHKRQPQRFMLNLMSDCGHNFQKNQS